MSATSKLMQKWGSDPSADRDGIWVEVAEGIEFRVARMGGHNLAGLAKLAEIEVPGEHDTLEQRAAYNVRVMSHVFIRDWRGMDESFTPAACRDLIAGMPDLVEHLTEVIRDRERFRPGSSAGSGGRVGGVESVDGDQRAAAPERRGAGGVEPDGHRSPAARSNGDPGDRIVPSLSVRVR